jgi:hypothetical protein
VFTARYELIPYMKHITFRLLKVKACMFFDYLTFPDTCLMKLLLFTIYLKMLSVSKAAYW